MGFNPFDAGLLSVTAIRPMGDLGMGIMVPLLVASQARKRGIVASCALVIRLAKIHPSVKVLRNRRFMSFKGKLSSGIEI